MNLFYAPDIEDQYFTLDQQESHHLVKVLRMVKGEEIMFTDGKGFYYRCKLVDDHPKRCNFMVLEKKADDYIRNFSIHIAIAPTKNISRFEWFLEKTTEIGIDTITPVICQHSERKELKPDRLQKILVSAMKQSLIAKLPLLQDPTSFESFIEQTDKNQKFIGYINDKVTSTLSEIYTPGTNATILIGPEGDFSEEEVNRAKKNGFQPVSLGPSRLRTETAGIVACHTINLLNG